jgi:hypothetical protein
VAAACADGIGQEDGLLVKLASAIAAPIPHAYFPRLARHFGPADNMVALMVAPHALPGLLTFLRGFGRGEIVWRSDQPGSGASPGVLYEYSWNHTTLRALKVDPAITYLQVGFGYPDNHDRIAAVCARFEGEILMHLEAFRRKGKTMLAGLPLLRFTGEARLEDVSRALADMGCGVYSPHRFTIEEGGGNTLEPVKLAFKRQADPKGLMNPGKMLTWHEPGWRYAGMYDHGGIARAPTSPRSEPVDGV